MLDTVHTLFGKKLTFTILFAVAIICGIFLNSVKQDSFIGYHPENIKPCATHLDSLPCTPTGWSFIVAVGAFFVIKIIWRLTQTNESELTLHNLPFGANNLNYLMFFDPLHRFLRRGIICRLVYH